MFNILIFHKRHGVNKKVKLTKWDEETKDWKFLPQLLNIMAWVFIFRVLKLYLVSQGQVIWWWAKHTTTELLPIPNFPIFERLFTHKDKSSIKHNLIWSCWRILTLGWSFSNNWHIVWLWEDCLNMEDEDIIHHVAITPIRNNKFNKGFSKCEPLDLSSLKRIFTSFYLLFSWK